MKSWLRSRIARRQVRRAISGIQFKDGMASTDFKMTVEQAEMLKKMFAADDRFYTLAPARESSRWCNCGCDGL